MPEHVDLVFEEAPAPDGRSGPCLAFVEVENEDGEGISIGEWIEREDGAHVLRFDPVEVLGAEDVPRLLYAAAWAYLDASVQADTKQARGFYSEIGALVHRAYDGACKLEDKLQDPVEELRDETRTKGDSDQDGEA